MALTVTVLGCSGTYAAAGNACSGYLVRDDGFNLLSMPARGRWPTCSATSSSRTWTPWW